MSTSESTELVGFLIETIRSNWPGDELPDDLRFIDRDDSRQIDPTESWRSRTAQLEETTYIDLGSGSLSSSPRGTGYDRLEEPTVDVKIVGLHADAWGSIESSAAFEQLTSSVIEAIYADRTRPLGDYTTLFIENEVNQSKNYRDLFLYTFDVRFRRDRQLG